MYFDLYLNIIEHSTKLTLVNLMVRVKQKTLKEG
jgi:hypothetical protein